MTAEGIWIFLDDSNFWIEAKKVKGYRLNKSFTEDPRLRIDVGGLANLISNGRVVNHATLYGSEPPPVDTVWKKIEEKGWEIKKHKRSEWTGKEKKVDTQIVADVTELVCDTQNREHGSTVVIVSGDNDMSPCIEKAIQRRWNVEVWALEKNLGGDLKRLRDKNPKLMTTHDLSQPGHFDKITFTTERFTMSPHFRNELLRRGIVLRQCVRQLQDEKNKEFIELRKTLDKFEWPWQHAWILPKSSEAAISQDLAILFLPCKDKNLDDDTPLKLFKTKLETLCEPKLCEQVLTYFDYSNTTPDEDTAPDLCFNRYTVLECEDADGMTTPSAATANISGADKVLGPADGESNPDCTSGRISPSGATHRDSTNKMTHQQYQDPGCPRNSSHQSILTEPKGDPFEHVKRKQRKQHQRYTTPCEYHFQCVPGKECKFSHTEQEESFFEKRNEYVTNKTQRNLYKYKTVMCNNIVLGTLCRHQNACMFAHSKEEQVCCKCHHQGHATNECQH
ncbi:uncharacterized protein [Haliotis cracherodii]|uniref:uncharacterized protein n=1 Tax=Haliotis cracherodii TaxID=6455 RepID=UPI0039EBA1EC